MPYELDDAVMQAVLDHSLKSLTHIMAQGVTLKAELHHITLANSGFSLWH